MAKATTTKIRLIGGCGRPGAEGADGQVLDVESDLAALLVKGGSATFVDAATAESAEPGKV